MQEGTWAAPGRVNLIGEHTDYNDGFVLPIALEQATTVRVRARQDRRLLLRSAQAGSSQETVGLDLDSLQPGQVNGWTAYVAGVAWALQSAGHRLPGFEAHFDSDLPIGAGLSSSAALECSIALALNEIADLDLDRAELAALARRAENDFVGVPTGGMDQRASLSCTAGHALLLDCRDDTVEQVAFDPGAHGLDLLVVDTRVHHSLGDGKYGERREQCERACRALGVASLREAAADRVERLDDDLLRRRARHVVTENARVLAVADALRDGRLADVGELFVASHASMRDDYEISAPELDVVVEAAMSVGALGARMTGGGFGGSAIVLAADREGVRRAVDEAFVRAGLDEPAHFAATPGPGARRLH